MEMGYSERTMERGETDMGENPQPAERRRRPRTFLGVPVRVHFAGVPKSVTLELGDITLEGSYFRTSGPKPRRGQWVAFGFVTASLEVCAARGRVVRLDNGGFAIQLEGANAAFESFVADVSEPSRHAA
jgi:hypothetical protein